MMAEGRARAEWDRAANQIAATINATPFRKGQPVKPSQINPYTARRVQEKPIMVSLRDIMPLLARQSRG